MQISRTSSCRGWIVFSFSRISHVNGERLFRRLKIRELEFVEFAELIVLTVSNDLH